MNKYRHLAPPRRAPQTRLTRMHAGKVRYCTTAYALEVCERMRVLTGEEFDAYLCPLCAGYHVGHRTLRGA